MLALLAITTAATMAGFSGYWVRRAPAFRVSWLLAGAAALIIGLAGALAAFDADPTVTTSMVAVAVVLIGSSPVLAVRADGNLGLRWVGILDLLAATLAGGILTWAVLIEPGWFPSGAAGRALAVAVALAVASTLAAITLARSARSYPVSLTIAAGLAVFIAGLGWSREELRTGGLTATSSAVGLALAAMLIGAWASTRFQVESSLPWSFTQQLRNTIGFYLFIALLIAGSVAAVQDGVSTQAVLVVRVASLALVFARFS
ncbi:MAG: hypothetical protein M3Y37_04245, partial [Chloroflexota bacterium]|nr:hypothetical protein [Chloroflexota bacterium]